MDSTYFAGGAMIVARKGLLKRRRLVALGALQRFISQIHHQVSKRARISRSPPPTPASEAGNRTAFASVSPLFLEVD
jgi:hypothetical protein